MTPASIRTSSNPGTAHPPLSRPFFELRTRSNRTVMVFDDETRALQECRARGANLTVWRVERKEELVQ